MGFHMLGVPTGASRHVTLLEFLQGNAHSNTCSMKCTNMHSNALTCTMHSREHSHALAGQRVLHLLFLFLRGAQVDFKPLL